MLILNDIAISDGGALIDDIYDDTDMFLSLAAPGFVIFTSCWTLLFVLYLLLTSATAYTRTDRPIGKFFNQKIALAVDSLSAIFWFAGFISLAQFYQDLDPCENVGESACGTAITSVLVGVCAWYESCSAFVLRGGY